MNIRRVHQPRPRALLLALLFWCAVLSAPATAAPLDIGDRAPDFTLQGSDGVVHRLGDYHGRVVVLAWFPKAFTGG